jgi:hypothetical protein
MRICIRKISLNCLFTYSELKSVPRLLILIHGVLRIAFFFYSQSIQPFFVYCVFFLFTDYSAFFIVYYSAFFCVLRFFFTEPRVFETRICILKISLNCLFTYSELNRVPRFLILIHGVLRIAFFFIHRLFSLFYCLRITFYFD